MEQDSTFFIVNSAFGKPGNIGMRVAKLVNSREIPDDLVFARSQHVESRAKIVSFGLLGDCLRIFNAIYLYVNTNFKSRRYDSVGFECFFFLWFMFSGRRLLARRLRQGKKCAVIYETSPRIIATLQTMGFKVFIDMPIAPVSYDKRMQSLFSEWPLPSAEYMYSREVKSLCMADQIICPSNFVKREIELMLENACPEIYVEPFGVDFPAVPKSTESATDELTFCFLGNVGTRKGIHYLLDAWEKVCKPHWRLLLCGRPEVGVVRRVRASRLLSESIKLRGFVDPVEVLPKSDLFVFPSLKEGSSKAVYEAMAFGLPSIVTFESGSIVTDGVEGLIVRAGSVIDLAEAMLALAGDAEMRHRMGDAAYQKVSLYSWSAYSQRITKRLRA